MKYGSQGDLQNCTCFSCTAKVSPFEMGLVRERTPDPPTPEYLNFDEALFDQTYVRSLDAGNGDDEGLPSPRT